MAPSAVAQGTPQRPAQSSVLTVESERFFSASLFGQRVRAELEAESAILAAENQRIEAELVEEERDLTQRRTTMEADAFRVLADAFDEKVQNFRVTQDAKSRDLNQRLEEGRVAFLQAAAPILEQLMREAGATVVLERSNVFISLTAIDITDLAITRMDAAIGDGAIPREE